MSCAIPQKVYKMSKAVVRLERTRRKEQRGIQNRCIVEELEARKEKAHSQGKQLSSIYDIDMCYHIEY